MRTILMMTMCLALAPCAPVRAQHEPAWWELDSDALALARICRHEAGFPSRRAGAWVISDDCAAINAVIERVRAAMEAHRERTVSIAEAVHAYSRGRIYDRTRIDAACDVAWLDEAASEPRCWRAGVPWARRADAWRALLDHARRIRAGVISHRCTEPPLHWGCGEIQTARGCRDHERAARAGWDRISCGDTRNWFYAGDRRGRSPAHPARPTPDGTRAPPNTRPATLRGS